MVFPIAGNINIDELSERLAHVELGKGSILALQIRQVDRMDLLNEFIIHLALFRVFASSSNVFILPESCRLYIELGNTFDNAFEKKIFYKKYLEDREHQINHFNLDLLEIRDNPLTVNPKKDKI